MFLYCLGYGAVDRIEATNADWPNADSQYLLVQLIISDQAVSGYLKRVIVTPILLM